jgi:soluble lytic murein transglycosylase-like protein
LPSCMLPDPLVALAAENSHSGGAADAGPDAGSGGDTGGERSEIEQLVHRLAPQYAVDPALALAVIAVESAFNAAAVSPKNAKGLMQLIPETAERFGVKGVFNPVENLKGGLAYLRWLLAYFQGDVPLVVAAYNAGERAVEKFRGIPPYPETRSYVRKITGIYTKASHPYEPGIVEPSLIMAWMKRARG